MAQDSNVARLFVEYSLLDLHTEETPLSLPKPARGANINYNYSKGEAVHDRLLTLHTAAKIAGMLVPREVLWTQQAESYVIFSQLFLWIRRTIARGGSC